MLAEQMSMTRTQESGIVRWFLDRAIYELHRLWACYWWIVRVHVAATHFIPRSCLEDPPEAWMRVLQGRGQKDQ